MRWAAVDFGRKLISVRESVYEGHFNSPKTRSSVRNIPMGEALEGIFLPLKGENATPGDLVFAGRQGTPLQPKNVHRRVIHPPGEHLELPKVGRHDLHHTSATRFHEHEPLRVARAILGHSDLQTTLGYTHVLPRWQREAMKRPENEILFPNVPKSQEEPTSGNSLIQ